MSSTQFPLPEKTWVQITTADKSGSIHHQEGNTVVVYTEAAISPAALNPATPVMISTLKGQDWTYFNVGAGDFVWAHAGTGGATLTVTPVGV